jgi:hypothetical protein
VTISRVGHAALFTRVARGDETALGHLYCRFGQVLYAVVYRIMGEPADAVPTGQELTAAAITDEPEGGSERPTTPVLMVGTFAPGTSREVRGEK